MEEDNAYKCIECGAPVPHLFQIFSSSLIKMTHCKKCDQVADKYIEYDAVIIVLDLLVHRLEAYRHIVHNAVVKNIIKFAFLLSLIEAYISWLRGRLLETIIDSEGFLLAATESEFYLQIVIKCLLQLLLFSMHSGVLYMCGDEFDRHTLFRMLTITGFSRVLLLPALAWNIDNEQSSPQSSFLEANVKVDYFYTVLCFIVTFTTHIQGMRALINCSILRSVFQCLLVCTLTWILYGIMQYIASQSDLFA